MNHIHLFTLAKKLSNHEAAIEWCREIELILWKKWCIRHKRPMVYVQGGLGRFRCRKYKKYNHSIAVAHNTWFERCHISIESCLIITYAFAWRFSFEQTMHECSIVNGQIISSETIADRFSFCREVCTIVLDKEYVAEALLGGVGKVVEIDECKIGRRKFEK